MPGAVTLVLLADEEAGGGIGFETLKKKLYRWFEDKIPGTLSCGESFCIRRAEMVEIELHMEARIADYQRLYRIQKGLEEKLAEFLDPEKGSFDGRLGHRHAAGTLPAGTPDPVGGRNRGAGTLRDLFAGADPSRLSRGEL